MSDKVVSLDSARKQRPDKGITCPECDGNWWVTQAITLSLDLRITAYDPSPSCARCGTTLVVLPTPIEVPDVQVPQEHADEFERVADINRRSGEGWLEGGNFLSPSEKAVKAVLALHRPDNGVGGLCIACTEDYGANGGGGVSYPCATVQALSEAGVEVP